MIRANELHDGFLNALFLNAMNVAFFCTVMESYFLGGIWLGRINGPNEANLTIASLGVVSYVYGKN